MSEKQATKRRRTNESKSVPISKTIDAQKQPTGYSRRNTAKNIVVHAKDFDLKTHCYFTPVSNKKMMRLVKCQVSPKNRRSVYIQFSGGGRIPPVWGVDVSTHGKTYLKFDISDDAEYKAMKELGIQAAEVAKQFSESWWPKGITTSQILENFHAFTSDPKPKEDGFWPPLLKAQVPINIDTGELRNCIIKDHAGVDFPLHDLPGKRWDAIVIEISGVYLTGKFTWGFMKRVAMIRLSEDATHNSIVDFLPKP